MNMAETSDWDFSAMEAWSKAVFKPNRLSIAVLAKASRPEDLYPSSIAKRLGLSPDTVGDHFRDLSDAGLLAKSKAKAAASRKGGRPGELYVRTEDEFWNCLQELGERFRRPNASGQQSS